MASFIIPHKGRSGNNPCIGSSTSLEYIVEKPNITDIYFFMPPRSRDELNVEL